MKKLLKETKSCSNCNYSDIDIPFIWCNLASINRLKDYFCPSWVPKKKRKENYKLPIEGNIKNIKSLKKDQKYKFDKDKIRYSLYPLDVLKEVVEILEFGANKYEEESWKKVEGRRYYDAALRHIFAWKKGEKKDNETKKNHLAHAICCLTFLLHFDLKEEKK